MRILVRGTLHLNALHKVQVSRVWFLPRLAAAAATAADYHNAGDRPTRAATQPAKRHVALSQLCTRHRLTGVASALAKPFLDTASASASSATANPSAPAASLAAATATPITSTRSLLQHDPA